jgi:coenzyme F420-0:L-glutamate ligase/coenzyme F420-1:gamma-L-glutamate ligase
MTERTERTGLQGADSLEVLPIRGIGDVTPGDDLAELITNAAPWLADGDVLVVTSKIVSKAEGRLVDVPADGPEREAAREEILASETARVVARRGPTAIVQTHHGFVMAAGGIDASNVDKTHLVLLPADPDASARRLHRDLRARGLNVGVIVSDTMGRAWRNGLTDVALGAAGIEPFRDHRGEIDPYGNELQLTQMAVIDELAGAGELVKGKSDQVPVAVVRGYPGAGRGDHEGAVSLLRDAASDMFSLGTAEARAAGLRDAALLPDGLLGGPVERDAAQPSGRPPGGPIDAEAVQRALATVSDAIAPGTVIAAAGVQPDSGATAALSLTPAEATPAAYMRLGADAHRLRAALAAEGLASEALPHQGGLLVAIST